MIPTDRNATNETFLSVALPALPQARVSIRWENFDVAHFTFTGPLSPMRMNGAQ